MNRYPLRTRAYWAMVIATAGTIAVELGFASTSDVFSFSRIAESVLTLLVVGGVLTGTTISGEKVVTPVHDPRDNEGRRLVPDVDQ